jgi:hypothetical protein
VCGVQASSTRTGGIVSENRYIGSRGIERQETRDHKTREFAKSDFPVVKGGQCRVTCG